MFPRYSVETRHPNESSWKFVHGIETYSMIGDILASPPFETPRGLLLRVKNKNGHEMYLGASNGSEFIDISHASELMKLHGNPGVSYIDLWNCSEKPEWMLFQVFKTATKRQYVSFAYQLFELSDRDINTIYSSLDEMIKQWINGGEFEGSITEIPRWARTNIYSQNIYAMICNLIKAIHHEEYSVYCSYIIDNLIRSLLPEDTTRHRSEMKRIRKRICDHFRRNIPFHLVIESVL